MFQFRQSNIEMVLTEQQLIDALKRSRVSFPATASVAHLRALYDELETGPKVQTAVESLVAGSSTLLDNSSVVSSAVSGPDNAPVEKTVALHDMAQAMGDRASVVDENLAGLDDKKEAGGREFDHGAVDLQERLRKEKQLLELQRNTALLRREAPAPQQFNRMNRIEFKDVEHAVSEFSGDDEYGVKKWILDFEEVVDAYEVDDRFRSLAARRLLKGTAKLFLRDRNLPTWPELRAALLQRFDPDLTGMEVREKLARRFKKADETYQRYVSIMEEIARQGEGISEAEVIQAIIHGLRDHTGHAAILDTARTIDELLQLLMRYEKLRIAAGRAPTSAPAKGNLTVASDKRVRPSDKEKRCYNCTKFGHISSDCKEPKRTQGACFACFSMDHICSACPTRRRTAAVVIDREGLPDASDDASQAASNDAIKEVSVAFPGVKTYDWTTYSNCDSLFDTGSPVSFIEHSKLPSEVRTDALTYSNFRGLDGTKLFTYGKTSFRVCLREQIEIIPLSVISDAILPNSMLLGRDCSEKFNIHLVQ